MTVVEEFYKVLNEANKEERVEIFAHFYKLYPHEFKLASMGPIERKFYDPKERR